MDREYASQVGVERANISNKQFGTEIKQLEIVPLILSDFIVLDLNNWAHLFLHNPKNIG